MEGGGGGAEAFRHRLAELIAQSAADIAGLQWMDASKQHVTNQAKTQPPNENARGKMAVGASSNGRQRGVEGGAWAGENVGAQETSHVTRSPLQPGKTSPAKHFSARGGS